MVNSLKRLNKIQVVSLILLVISFILVCFGINNSTNFFWVSLGLFSMAFIWNFLSLAIVDRTSKEVELILKGGKKNGSK